MAENKEDKDIDLLKFAHKLWINKKLIIKVTLIGAIIGLVIAFSIPKEYTSTVVFTTNSNDTKTGNVGALASLAGINIANMNSSNVLPPELYPDIMRSTPFIRGLLHINVHDKERGIDTTLYSYLKDEQKSPWWSYILKTPGLLVSLFKLDNGDKIKIVEEPYFISDEELDIIEMLKNTYSITTDKKTGITTFDVTLQSSAISAFLADTINSYLQSYIIQERTKKALNDLENSRRLYQQYKKSYNESQQKLAVFVDRNKNIISESYRVNQRKLENEVNLAYTVYNQMAQQVQMNEIKVQDDTPVFTIIQPAIEPLYPSTPNRKIILISFILVGILVSSIWLLKRDLISLLKD